MEIRHKVERFMLTLGNRYSQSSPEGRRNPWVIAWFGIVATFLVVNGIFVVFAVTSNPGLVVNNYYEQGREFEKNAMKLMAMHKKLQWLSKLEIPDAVVLNTPDTYRFSAVDSKGVPINDADVQLVAYRPSDANADFTATLHAVAPGLYQASLTFPLPGVWDLNVKVQRGADHYEMAQRLSVQLLNHEH
ncbi:MAG: FixH family protein [Gammaproteobacteria bacterium]